MSRRSTPPASSSTARATMLANRAESSVERGVRSELHRRGLRFRKHLAPVPGLRCKPDILFTRHRLAVFVHGCFWHRCPVHGTSPKANGEWWRAKLDGNVERDRRNRAALEAAGWTVAEFWEHESPEAIADAVGNLIGRMSENPGG
ncbi:very short patch repair endonuclease [Patulibacter brassicae]|uniref:Very short patch repair endonuclease n=1 Tax=Patulibacter brassicae TaxID=1705717 RepID=A0ABU4VJU7_9ACTN|nr:very short patch repair endonuclease [Patulibacter brassicae]MDX8152083.1 very short patch repair endonuclease [Patulibacter brassicae]